jgi:hypothetical protein
MTVGFGMRGAVSFASARDKVVNQQFENHGLGLDTKKRLTGK